MRDRGALKTPAYVMQIQPAPVVCGWCGIPHHHWQAIRCIETEAGTVFCSAICLESFEHVIGARQEVVSELPFPWDREVLLDPR